MPTSCRVAFLSRLGARTHLGVYLLTRPSRRLSTKTPRHKGFSLKDGAVARYYLTSEYRSRYLRQLRNMINQRDTDFSHPDLQLPRMRRDEADVQSLVQLMETSWLNSFSFENGELVSLSTAAEAPPEVAKDLLEAYKIGRKHSKLSSKIACKKMLHLRSSVRK